MVELIIILGLVLLLLPKTPDRGATIRPSLPIHPSSHNDVDVSSSFER